MRVKGNRFAKAHQDLSEKPLRRMTAAEGTTARAEEGWRAEAGRLLYAGVFSKAS